MLGFYHMVVEYSDCLGVLGVGCRVSAWSVTMLMTEGMNMCCYMVLAHPGSIRIRLRCCCSCTCWIGCSSYFPGCPVAFVVVVDLVHDQIGFHLHVRPSIVRIVQYRGICGLCVVVVRSF